MGFFPYASAAHQKWVHNYKPAILFRDQGRFLRLDVNQRVASISQWNRSLWWPLLGVLVIAVALLMVARNNLRKRERTNARGEVLA
jgi:hypothetical protein